MNSNLEKNWDVDQEVYETLNTSTILKPRNLRIEEQPIEHHVFLVKVGAKRKVWIGSP
jgi:hypothetical protein